MVHSLAVKHSTGPASMRLPPRVPPSMPRWAGGLSGCGLVGKLRRGPSRRVDILWFSAARERWGASDSCDTPHSRSPGYRHFAQIHVRRRRATGAASPRAHGEVWRCGTVPLLWSPGYYTSAVYYGRRVRDMQNSPGEWAWRPADDHPTKALARSLWCTLPAARLPTSHGGHDDR